MGQHPDEIALRRDLDRVQRFLDRLDRDDAVRAAEPVHGRDAQQHALGLTAFQRHRHQLALARLQAAQALREAGAELA